MRRIVILLGPPGVGKGTIARALLKRYGFEWLSSGELLRNQRRTTSEAAARIAELIDSGRLVPDELIVDLVKKELSSYHKDCYLLLDGFPRTLPQAVALEEFFAQQGDEVSLVIELQAEASELERRVLGRAKSEGRVDDTLATFRHRMGVFQDRTAPLIEFYSQRGKLQAIDGMGSPEDVVDRVGRCIRQALPIDSPPEKKEAG